MPRLNVVNMYQNVNDLLLLNLVIEVTYTERVVGAAESGSLACVGFFFYPPHLLN